MNASRTASPTPCCITSRSYTISSTPSSRVKKPRSRYSCSSASALRALTYASLTSSACKTQSTTPRSSVPSTSGSRSSSKSPPSWTVPTLQSTRTPTTSRKSPKTPQSVHGSRASNAVSRRLITNLMPEITNASRNSPSFTLLLLKPHFKSSSPTTFST